MAVTIMFVVGFVILAITLVGGVAFTVGENKLSDKTARNFDNWGNQ